MTQLHDAFQQIVEVHQENSGLKEELAKVKDEVNKYRIEYSVLKHEKMSMSEEC